MPGPLEQFLRGVAREDGAQARKEVEEDYMETRRDLVSVGITNQRVLNQFALDITRGKYSGLVDDTFDIDKLRILNRLSHFQYSFGSNFTAVREYASGAIDYEELKRCIKQFKRTNEEYFKANYG